MDHAQSTVGQFDTDYFDRVAMLVVADKQHRLVRAIRA